MPDATDGRVAGACHPAAPEVEEAWHELQAFLSSFGDRESRVRHLTQAIGLRAVRRWQARPERPLVDIAIEEAEADLAAWAHFVLGRERIGDHSPTLVARVAFVACRAPERWPGRLLSYDLPAAFVTAMREVAPQPTPPERRGRMVAQPLERWSPGDVLAPKFWNRLIAAVASGTRVPAVRRP